jgi:hypothetical protein
MVVGQFHLFIGYIQDGAEAKNHVENGNHSLASKWSGWSCPGWLSPNRFKIPWKQFNVKIKTSQRNSAPRLYFFEGLQTQSAGIYVCFPKAATSFLMDVLGMFFRIRKCLHRKSINLTFNIAAKIILKLRRSDI